MKTRIGTALIIMLIFGACQKQSPPASEKEVVRRAKVGTKTDLYEVIAKGELRLAPGATSELVDGPSGPGTALLIRWPNGDIGGYVVCGCHDSAENFCKTINDNPNNPKCEGGCRGSEGSGSACDISEPLPGPPRNPLFIR